MADVTLTIGGRPHTVACRDGEEARVTLLGQMIEDRWAMASRAAGAAGSERAMLFVALMLADDLDEAANRAPVGAAVSESALARIADRLEALAEALEHSPQSA
ncbi:cell division protein ZapA [Sphingomonas oligophenolica]|uniref:Cell division protein ZapA n=1 Tax=Sphingomonas oligophenolica TaxID=301154 RepID=A0A502CI61_9SPHN|nr:cell division protein ZapA [Sphingomonas oligophenolica]TPG12412.1 cell division protein ZapA [Sphingomonas oligophenolica]